MMKWFKRKKESKAQALTSETPEHQLREGVPPGETPAPTLAADSREDTAFSEEKPLVKEEPIVGEALEPVLQDAVSLDQEIVEPQVPDSSEESGEPIEPGEQPQKRRFFMRLKERMHKTRENLAARVDRLVLGKKAIDLDLLDELEEVLITSDLGVKTTQTLLGRVTEKIKRNELKDPEKLREHLQAEIREILNISSPPPVSPTAALPHVIMIVGVNGVGKTTTIGKLAHRFKSEGQKVMLAACDTFRAAAVEQLLLWGERADVPVIRQKSGSDPSAVAFDALDSAVSRHMDLLLLDTAGRMHTKVNLMEELKKIHRTLNRKMESAPNEVWLVLDASTGQNALSQARLFREAIGITGLILTKLDGTAKGGIVVAICDELQIPVRYIGIGEKVDDLRPFNAEEFAGAIF